MRKTRQKPDHNFRDTNSINSTNTSLIRRFMMICLFAITVQIGYAQEFITEWTFPDATSELQFKALTTGDVNYTWSASPSGNNGSGIFNQEMDDDVVLTDLSIEAGDVVILEMSPENLSRFYMSNGPDKDRITDVLQWGDVLWSSMNLAFWGCTNLDISATDIPDLSNVTIMSRMFYNAPSVNPDMGDWDVSGVTEMRELFHNAESFNQDIGNWDVSSVTDMSRMFQGAVLFNQDIGGWDVSNVTNMARVFEGAVVFDQNIGNWDVSNVTNMRHLFRQAFSFSHDIGAWDVSSVENMKDMFNNADSFNQDIGNWDVSSVTDMEDMFGNSDSFNQDIGGWDVSSVETMKDMFEDALVFNQDISNWDVSSVENMSDMFRDAVAFNQDIGSWDVSSVTEMIGMFRDATVFNQDISNWDVSNVENMFGIFRSAASFNQNLGSWILHPDVSMNNFFNDCGIDCDNYTATLAGFRANNPTVLNRNFGANDVQYGTEAVAYRDSLIELQGWTISGDIPSENECSLFLSSETLTSAESNPVVVYPNPARNHIVIEGSHAELDEVSIYNSRGQQITAKTPIRRISNDEVTIDLSDLVTGIYFIQTLTNSTKVFKE